MTNALVMDGSALQFPYCNLGNFFGGIKVVSQGVQSHLSGSSITIMYVHATKVDVQFLSILQFPVKNKLIDYISHLRYTAMCR